MTSETERAEYGDLIAAARRVSEIQFEPGPDGSPGSEVAARLAALRAVLERIDGELGAAAPPTPPLRLSRDLYTNVMRLRTGFRRDAVKWAARALTASRRAERDIRTGAEPSMVPAENVYDAIAKTVAMYADTLDLILSVEEKVTTEGT